MVKSLKDIDFLRFVIVKQISCHGKIKILQKVIERKTKLSRPTGHPAVLIFIPQEAVTAINFLGSLSEMSICILMLIFNLISPR